MLSMECMSCSVERRRLPKHCERGLVAEERYPSRDGTIMVYTEATDDSDDEQSSCWALLRRETEQKRPSPRRAVGKKSPTRTEEAPHPARQQGDCKSCVSLYSNSTTAMIHNHDPRTSQHSSAHRRIDFSSTYREVDIDKACRAKATGDFNSTPEQDKGISPLRPSVPSSADDSGVGLSFDAPDTASFESKSLLSLDEVLAEEVKQAMVELDLREKDQPVAKRIEQRKKMLIARNYFAVESEEISVRAGELVSVMHEDHDWFLVETEDMRFGFVPRTCCMAPYSVMFSDTAATCTGSVACLSVLSDDELQSNATSRSSTLDRMRSSRQLPRAPSSAHITGKSRESHGCLAQTSSTPGKENRGNSRGPSSGCSSSCQPSFKPIAGIPTYMQPDQRFSSLSKPISADTHLPISPSSVCSKPSREDKIRFVALKGFVAGADEELSVSSGQWLHSSPSKSEKRKPYSPAKKSRFFHSDWRWVRCPYTKKEGFVPEDILAVCH